MQTYETSNWWGTWMRCVSHKLFIDPKTMEEYSEETWVGPGGKPVETTRIRRNREYESKHARVV